MSKNKMKQKIKLKDIEDFENVRDNIGERFRDWREGINGILLWLFILSAVVLLEVVFN